MCCVWIVVLFMVGLLLLSMIGSLIFGWIMWVFDGVYGFGGW